MKNGNHYLLTAMDLGTDWTIASLSLNKRMLWKIAQVTKTKTTSFGIFPIDIACHSTPVPKLSDDCVTLFPYVSDVTGVTRG